MITKIITILNIVYLCTDYGKNRTRRQIKELDFGEDLFLACHIVAKMKIDGVEMDSIGFQAGLIFIHNELSQKINRGQYLARVAIFLLSEAEESIEKEICHG